MVKHVNQLHSSPVSAEEGSERYLNETGQDHTDARECRELPGHCRER